MEKATTHSSTLAWKIPWMEKPGRLQSMGSLRVGHDWATSLSLFTFMHWRRNEILEWQPTPVFLPVEPQERRSLVGCRLWGRTESDTTEDLAAAAAATASGKFLLSYTKWLITYFPSLLICLFPSWYVLPQLHFVLALIYRSLCLTFFPKIC